MGIFVIKKAKDGYFFFIFEEPDGEVIMTSKKYRSKEGCKAGVQCIKNRMPHSGIIEEIDPAVEACP